MAQWRIENFPDRGAPTKLRQGYIFTGVCDSVHGEGGSVGGRGGHAWQGGRVWQGEHARQGACVAGGYVWKEGIHGRGACMSGACIAGGHMWQGGVHGMGACSFRQKYCQIIWFCPNSGLDASHTPLTKILDPLL